MSKIPCATCPDMCENALSLYRAYHLTKEVLTEIEGKITKMSLYCHKTKLTYEVEGKEIPNVERS